MNVPEHEIYLGLHPELGFSVTTPNKLPFYSSQLSGFQSLQKYPTKEQSSHLKDTQFENIYFFHFLYQSLQSQLSNPSQLVNISQLLSK